MLTYYFESQTYVNSFLDYILHLSISQGIYFFNYKEKCKVIELYKPISCVGFRCIINWVLNT